MAIARLSRWTPLWALMAVALLPVSAHAIFPRKPGPPPAARGHAVYGPQVEHYIVVDPTPWQRPDVSSSQAVPHTWPVHELETPVYPYGWFGARAYPQRVVHYGYFGAYADTIRARQF